MTRRVWSRLCRLKSVTETAFGVPSQGSRACKRQDLHDLRFCETTFTHAGSPLHRKYAGELQLPLGLIQGVLTQAALPQHLTKHTPRGGANRRCDCDCYRPDTLGRTFADTLRLGASLATVPYVEAMKYPRIDKYLAARTSRGCSRNGSRKCPFLA